MSTRIIETPENLAARSQGINPIPAGVIYTDPVAGTVIDYISETKPEAKDLAAMVYVAAEKEGGYEVLKEKPADFEAKHDYAGWPSVVLTKAEVETPIKEVPVEAIAVKVVK